MYQRRITRILAVLLCLLSWTAPRSSQAQVPAVTVSGTVSSFIGVFGTLGWQFEPATNIIVTSLGAYKDAGTPYAQGFPIGLWDSTGTLLATALAPAVIPDNTYGFTAIAPLPLNAGQTYTIGISTLISYDPGPPASASAYFAIFPPTSQVAFDPAIIYKDSVYDDVFTSGIPTLTWPTIPMGIPGLFAVQPNFQFTPSSVVPEPGGIALLLGAGISGSALWLLRRRRGA